MPEACERVAPLLSAWLDDELDEERAELVARHVAVCAGCADHLEGLADVASVLASLPLRRLPSALAEERPPVPAVTTRRALGRRARVLAVAAGLAVGAALSSGVPERSDPAEAVPVDLILADHLVQSLQGRETTPVLLGRNP